MSKRIKSFLMTLGSIAATAFIGVVLTPEWGGFLTWIHEQAAAFGVPAAIVAVVGVFISELWKEFINRRKISDAAEDMGVAAVSNHIEDLDLY